MVSNINYNYLDESIIKEISKNPEKAKYIKYTQVKEFYKLDIKDMARITRQISIKAELNFINNEYFGSYRDYNGDIYYYEISINDTFSIYDIRKYVELSKEAYDEGIKE